jgi:hypothetical protein
MVQKLSYAIGTPSPIQLFIERFKLDQWELWKDFLVHVARSKQVYIDGSNCLIPIVPMDNE